MHPTQKNVRNPKIKSEIPKNTKKHQQTSTNTKNIKNNKSYKKVTVLSFFKNIPGKEKKKYKIKPNKVVSVENEGAELDFEADNIIIATGGRSRVIDSIPQDGKKIIGYREAMTLQKQPKKMIIVGSGAIGIEFAYFYNSMGTNVTVVEYLPKIAPLEDDDISKELEKILKSLGLVKKQKGKKLFFKHE